MCHLCESGRPRAGLRVHHVDPVAAERRQNEPVPGTLRVVVATGTGVPPAVVELVPDIAHRQAVDDLGSAYHRVTKDIQRWPKKFVLGCVIPPLAVGASSRNLGQTCLANSVQRCTTRSMFYKGQAIRDKI